MRSNLPVIIMWWQDPGPRRSFSSVAQVSNVALWRVSCVRECPLSAPLRAVCNFGELRPAARPQRPENLAKHGG